MVALAQQAYQCSGYDELALGGLSVSDYPFLQELLVSLLTIFKDKGVSVSLPSIKPKTMLGNLTALIASVKKTGLTFAPEAGSMRMRAVLGKQFNDAEFFQALEESYRSGYQHVKLYFLMGVPLETDADLDGIVDFSVAVSQAGKKACNRPAQVNVSVNALIPKPHTPFQWFGVDERDTIERKQIYIRKKLCSNKRLKISFHNLEMSFWREFFRAVTAGWQGSWNGRIRKALVLMPGMKSENSFFGRKLLPKKVLILRHILAPEASMSFYHGIFLTWGYQKNRCGRNMR